VLISGQTQHYIPSTAYTETGKTLTDKDVKIFDLSNYMNWTSFEHFTEAMVNMWCIKLNLDLPDRANCDCPVFLKQYQCKHTLGLAIRLKIVEPPSAARSIPLGQKRKPGRPKKARPALVMQ